MVVIILVALKDLQKRWKLALVMSLLFSLCFSTYLALVSFQKSLTRTYFSLNTDWLVIQKSNGGGEIHGSRLEEEIGMLLVNNGYASPVPEIHQVVGTSLATAIMIRGVQPEDIHKISPYTLIAGRELTTNDSARQAMVGVSLAKRQNLAPGNEIKIRGRVFKVIGIFSTGSYEDNQAWISLKDAQSLLNYGTDVSIYFIPDGGVLKEGDPLTKGVSVGRRGDTGKSYGREAMSFFNYLGLVGGFVGIATLITLTSLLWRLVWLHRHEFGVLRTIGYGKSATAVYLLTQAASILLVGSIIGNLFAYIIIFSRIQNFSSFGIGLQVTLDFYTIGITTLITIIFALLGIAFPLIRINKMTTTELLGRD
jgi:putative ABC transport system permease protein